MLLLSVKTYLWTVSKVKQRWPFQWRRGKQTVVFVCSVRIRVHANAKLDRFKIEHKEIWYYTFETFHPLFQIFERYMLSKPTKLFVFEQVEAKNNLKIGFGRFLNLFFCFWIMSAVFSNLKALALKWNYLNWNWGLFWYLIDL